MASSQLPPENVGLRYGSANVFERADTRAKVIALLGPEDPFTVLGAETRTDTSDEFYQVRLADGTLGFVYAHNLVGSHMPLTDREQHNADDQAAADAKPPGGWRGLRQRVDRGLHR